MSDLWSHLVRSVNDNSPGPFSPADLLATDHDLHQSIQPALGVVNVPRYRGPAHSLGEQRGVPHQRHLVLETKIAK